MFQISSSSSNQLLQKTSVKWKINTGLREIQYDLIIQTEESAKHKREIFENLPRIPKEVVSLILEYDPKLSSFNADCQFFTSSSPPLRQVDFLFQEQQWKKRSCNFAFYWKWKNEYSSRLKELESNNKIVSILEMFMDELESPALLLGKRKIRQVVEPFSRYIHSFHLIQSLRKTFSQNSLSQNAHVVVLENPILPVKEILHKYSKIVQIYFEDENGFEIY